MIRLRLLRPNDKKFLSVCWEGSNLSLEIMDLDLRLENIENELKKITRRQNEIEKDLSLIFQDRTLLEDLQGSVAHLKEIIILNQQHQDTGKNSIQADVSVVAHEVKDMRKDIKDKTVIVKSNQKSLFEKLKKILKRG